MLKISDLQKQSMARVPLFKNSRGEIAHPTPDGSDWSLYDWYCALIGEVGEFANIWKKVRRGDLTIDDAREELGNELADIVCYLVILLTRMGVDDIADTVRRETLADVLDPQGMALSDPARGVFDLIGDIYQIEWHIIEKHSDAAEMVGRLETVIYNTLTTISAMANGLEIDLSDAVIRKFNAVSDRVGCDIYL